ncbi:hypothetical protein KCP78_15855 [Salmonella enterica subsp. enterica]|nr:hypothetical protein KCP78_15855 [Salmonella enterica subsp. enterica]
MSSSQNRRQYSVSWRVLLRAAGWMTVTTLYPKKAAYRSVSLLHKTRQCKLAGFTRAAGWMTVHGLYAEKRLIGRFTSSQNLPRRVLLWGDRMNDCPRHARKRLIGQFHLFCKSLKLRRVLLIRPVKGIEVCRRRQRHYPAIN